MKWLILVAALLSASLPVDAQTYPSPQFAAPPAADNSGSAETTSWVRGQNYLSSTGDLSQSTVTAAGSTVARTQAARAATVYNVIDYGGVADGVTDLAPALNAIGAAMSSNRSNEILIPAGSYAIKSAVTFTGVAPTIRGQGFTAGPNPSGATGTWITITGSGYVPFTIQGTNARGATVRDIAFTETQPAFAAGWTPAPWDYVFKILNTLGEVTFDNVLFAGVTRGIYADNSGRLNIKNVAGQFYTAGIEIDDCYDIPRVEHLHAWSYETSNVNVIAYQEANSDTLILRRVDGIFIGDLFSLAARSVIHLTTGANGVTTKLYASNVYADFATYGVWIDANNANGQIANITTQHNDQTVAGSILVGSRGLYVTGNTVGLQVGAWRTNNVGGPVIDLEGYGGHVDIGTLWANTYGTPGAGTPAVEVGDTGSSPGNVVNVMGLPWLQGVSPLYLFNPSTNGGRERAVIMNMVGNDANEARFYGAAAGGTPSLSSIGADSSIDLGLSAKSITGSVRLEANGQTVLRVDNANSGTDDILIRSGSGTIVETAEGGDADVDIYQVAKGPTGGERLLANGLTTFRTDNPNGGDSDVLVRPGTGAASLIAESASAAADIYVTAKSTGSVHLQSGGADVLRGQNLTAGNSDLLLQSQTGAVLLRPENAGNAGDLLLSGLGASNGVRLQANGQTTVRTDNPAAASNDMLIRPGASLIGIIAEGAAARVDLNLTPKGGGRIAQIGTQPAGVGFAGTGTYLLVGSSTSTAATRLTTDGLAAGTANCVNPPNNAAFDLFVEVVGLDTTTDASASRFRAIDVMMLHGTTAASTQVVNGAAAAAANGGIGSGSSATYTVAADTTNGCLTVSVTPPNADTWHWAARVRTTEVQ